MRRDTVVPEVDELPGSKSETRINRHKNVAGTSTFGFDTVWDVTNDAVGPFFTDIDGNVLMDFSSQVGAMPLGFNHPAITEHLEKLDLQIDPLKIAGSSFYFGSSGSFQEADLLTPTHLMESLTNVSDHYDFDNVFLSNSGAEAIENAIKICYNRGGHRGITFNGGFHGRTLGALSLNRSKQVHRKGYPEIAGISEAPYCSCEETCNCGWKTNGPGGNILADELHPDAGSLPPSEVSYIVIEPFQGEGGYRIPSEEFISDVKEISEQYDINVIADEVQSGLGRTGEFWAVDHLELEPDVITAAKGLRVGATISRKDMFPDEESRIASTWGGGDIINIIQGGLTLKIIEEENLLDNVRKRGEQALDLLHDHLADGVTDIRGRGLMLAVEFETKQRRKEVTEKAFELGMLILGCGRKSIRLLPPLDVRERELQLGIELVEEAVIATE